MGAITPTYATKSTLTITLASLANGSQRQSAAVDNGTNDQISDKIRGKITTGTSPTADSYIYIWVAANWDTSDYEANASGSDAAYTPDGSENILRLLKAIKVDATSNQTYEFAADLKEVYDGDVIPSKYVIIVQNETGAALNATGTNHEINREGYVLNAA